MRRFNKILMLVPALAIIAACGRADKPDATADALSRDLQLAATAQPYGQQFVSPQEMGYAGQYPQPYGMQQPYGAYGQYPQPAYGQPVYYPQAPTQVVYQPAPRRTSSSGTIYRAPSRVPSGTVTKRNTKRDALIGATAGAVMGSVIGRDVKGAVIGAAAGGLLGAVVGHTVDVQRAP
jgi:hypothetical protein